MKPSTWSALEVMLGDHRDLLVAGGVARPLVEQAIARLGAPLNSDYVEFVARYGGAMVRADPVFGLRAAEAMGVDATLEAETLRFRAQEWPGTAEGLVVSVDGRGNPIVLCADGRLNTYDHDAGETVEVAPRFEAFILLLLTE